MDMEKCLLDDRKILEHFLAEGATEVQIYISIDDTDTHDTPGSGHLAELIARELKHESLTSDYSPITRHQLFVHEAVPFTSHNSSMCFTADIEAENLEEVVEVARRLLERGAAPGSDPGLCIAVDSENLDRQALIEFGVRAKRNLLTKKEANGLARMTGVHLSEHGGTGDGIIGALAAVGLRLHGSDGRFRGWLRPGQAGRIVTGEELCIHFDVDGVVDEDGWNIPMGDAIVLAEDKVKTVFLNHRRVVPVTRNDKPGEVPWITLDKATVKRY